MVDSPATILNTPRDPQIRVSCTEELETQLLDALDRAKNARNAAAIDALTDLTVSVVRARRQRG